MCLLMGKRGVTSGIGTGFQIITLNSSTSLLLPCQQACYRGVRVQGFVAAFGVSVRVQWISNCNEQVHLFSRIQEDLVLIDCLHRWILI